jgi:hypothetical protein
MVLGLFALSFILAMGVSYAMGRVCRDVSEPLLARFFAKNPSVLMAKYLQFVVVVVGVSSGARIRLLEDFVGAPSWNRPDLVEQLTPEVWALAFYHTFIDSLLGILWLLLILGLVFATALIVLRRSTNTSLKWLLSERERGTNAPPTEPVVPIR